MKTCRIEPKTLEAYLENVKISTMEQMKKILKTKSRMTVFRKLEKLGYISSCSHSGKYYALKRSAEFDEFGLWRYDSVLFSKNGTLKNAIKRMIDDSEEGMTASELSKILQVKVEDTLYVLATEKSIFRKKISGVYRYYAVNRKSKQKLEPKKAKAAQSENISDEVKAALVIFYGALNEKQRRLYAGSESLKIGRGGDQEIAEMFGLDRKTVSKGRKELLRGRVDSERIRNPGGGRKQTKKNSKRCRTK